MKYLSDVIREAIFTERSTKLSDTQNAYTFKVDPKASKIDIKRAIEDAFDVKVDHVRTMLVRGRSVSRWSRGGWVSGSKASWKKAIVKLQPGHTIDFV